MLLPRCRRYATAAFSCIRFRHGYIAIAMPLYGGADAAMSLFHFRHATATRQIADIIAADAALSLIARFS